jgi:hypothetical protein
MVLPLGELNYVLSSVLVPLGGRWWWLQILLLLRLFLHKSLLLVRVVRQCDARCIDLLKALSLQLGQSGF